jgi:CHAT domain-containing protein/predicted negative regulator of RcsB-dependent stress response
MDLHANLSQRWAIIIDFKLMMKYFLFVVLFAVTTACLGQTDLAAIDSLISDAQYDRAGAQVEEVLLKTVDSQERVILENKKAEIAIRAGKFDEAERILEVIKLKPLPGFLQAVTQINQGFLYLNQGRNDLALTTLLEALHHLEKERKQNTLEGAQLLSHLGNLYLATGKYSQAEEQLTMAFTIRAHLVKENSDLIAGSLNDLGLVYSTIDDNKALDYYEKALKIYEQNHGKTHPKIAIANTNIGLVYRAIEFYGDAINNLESALAIWEQIYPRQAHPTKAFVLFNLGQTYLKMGNKSAAQGFYDRALKAYQESYGKKHPGISTVLNAIGVLKLSSNDYDEALTYFQQAITSNVSDFNNANFSRNPGLKNYYSGNTLLFSLLNKAEALEAKHYGKSLRFSELTLAIKTLQVCDSLIDDLRQQITNESDKILLGTIATDVYAAGVRIAYEAASVAAIKKNWHELAFYFAEKSKSAVLLEAISDSNAKSFSGIPEDLLEKEKKLKSEIALTAQKLALKPTDSEEQYLRQMHYALNREYENFTKQLETQFPSYYNLKFNVATPTINNLQSKLNDVTAIVSYFVDEKNNQIYIFQITSKKFRIQSHQLSKDFQRNLNGLRNSIVYNELKTFKSAVEELSDILVPHGLPANIKELVLLPTGKLSIIPFEVLMSRKLNSENSFASFPYLLKKYAIRYEFCAALILQKTALVASTEGSIFLCAPVVFTKDGLNELPGTESEVNEIATLFESKKLKSSIMLKEDANERIVKAGSLKTFSYLHFATHGIVDEANPALSKIFLYSSGLEDGHLYAGEIYTMELNADLVTLSACQTGLGKISKGEGVIGLSRALVYAGARNIIVSFWSVADQSTAILMKNFYKQKLESPSSSFGAALRLAKLQLLNDFEYAPPFYWAPFILVGF